MSLNPQQQSYLFYGDNLPILRKKVKDNSVDLCYIDPPFNSKRDYNQIYNNVGNEDKAQAQAFVDTWTWDSLAEAGLNELLSNHEGRFNSATIDLVRGLAIVLQKGSLLAYTVSMALRITEIRRVLKDTGSFYLHCDPTASHYLKLILDAVFVRQGGEFKNEIVWHYRRWTGIAKKFQSLHDTIFFYTKTKNYTFNVLYTNYTIGSKSRKEQGILNRFKKGSKPFLVSDKSVNEKGVRENDVWQIPFIAPSAKERLGYPTQKPEALLKKIISASTNPGDVVLDAYCGCGTTVAVAQYLNRRWIGIDITYQSISLILRRLEQTFGKEVLDEAIVDGIPKDMSSAFALAQKKDDRLRKEFEKWAVLTFTVNRAAINEKKGADKGVDARAYFKTGRTDSAKIIFQVKSGAVKRSDIATLRGDMERESAVLAYLVTLREPTSAMMAEAKSAGQYYHEDMGRSYDKISIVTVSEIVEKNKRLDIPLSLEVLSAAVRAESSEQIDLL
jgi:site-specific DNA-methyltransferase (adenine-specific)